MPSKVSLGNYYTADKASLQRPILTSNESACTEAEEQKQPDDAQLVEDEYQLVVWVSKPLHLLNLIQHTVSKTTKGLLILCKAIPDNRVIRKSL